MEKWIFEIKRGIVVFIVLFIMGAISTKSNAQLIPSIVKDSISFAASTEYKSGTFQEVAYGNRYRKSWRTPVKVPVFDMSTTFAELTPVKKGGGMSTKSLRLEDKTGREYVLRSVYKNGRAGVKDRFRETIYEDILQDLRVGAHPFAAQVVAPLADAVGIYHTRPVVYFLPKQDQLGEYKEDFGGELYLFEEYPNEGWEYSASFGDTEKIIGYDRLIEKVFDSPKHQVDERWTLKNRLFDLFIGDYDRHDDQWRWATFPDEDNKTIYYRPIPRDRDQAFYDINGVIPWVLSRDFIHIQQKPFAKRIQDMKEFASNAKHFDRTWLTGLEKADWVEVAKELENSLTDEVIEKAATALPPEIYALNGRRLIKVLKGRRNNMVKHALQLYRFLAKYVDVVGTSKKEHFLIQKDKDKQLTIKVYALNKKGEKTSQFYERTFDAKVTKEIRLYGLDGEDTFEFAGVDHNPILVRIIGGEAKDEVTSVEQDLGGKKVVVYDNFDGLKLPSRNNFVNRLSNDSAVNEYNRKELQYHQYLPVISFGQTEDDGFFLGGGVTFTRYGFRKQPYGSRHHFSMRFSTQTDAFNFTYWSDFTKAIGSLNFNPAISFDRPVIFNYYGLGNDSGIMADNEPFHWVRMKRFTVEPLLKKIDRNQNKTTQFGPFFQNVIVVTQPGRIAADAPSLFRENDFGNKSFLGFLVKHENKFLDDETIPTKGWRYNIGLTYYRNLNEELGYANLEGSITGYAQIKIPFKVNLGSRIGFAHLSNDNYYFFHNNNIGGNNNLRGFHNNRFGGTTSLYGNLDIRVPLFYYKNHIAPGEVGLSVGLDTGRVWYPDANEGGWKNSISPGIWWTPYRFTSVNFFYSATSNGEENTTTLRLGFFF